jgi:hypothetical protein
MLEFPHLARLRTGEASKAKALKAALVELLTCMAREEFFGDSYDSNAAELATCVQRFHGALMAAGGESALWFWSQTAAVPGKEAAQLLLMGEDANAEWIQSLFSHLTRYDATRWFYLREGIKDFGEAVLAKVIPGRPQGKHELALSAKKPRLTINVAQCTATLDGQSYDVKSPQTLRWLKVLADRPGEWIASADLHHFDPELDGMRPHRRKKYLPTPILEMIESETGKGSRLKLA